MKVLNNIKSHRTVLQWIPSLCGIEGNERADKLAKKRSESKEQEDNTVSLAELNTITKALFRTPAQKDSLHLLERQEQVTIFRLRTGHNRLNKHLDSKLKVKSCAIPYVFLWRGRARCRPHLTRLQEFAAVENELWPEPLRTNCMARCCPYRRQ